MVKNNLHDCSLNSLFSEEIRVRAHATGAQMSDGSSSTGGQNPLLYE